MRLLYPFIIASITAFPAFAGNFENTSEEMYILSSYTPAQLRKDIKATKRHEKKIKRYEEKIKKYNKEAERHNKENDQMLKEHYQMLKEDRESSQNHMEKLLLINNRPSPLSNLPQIIWNYRWELCRFILPATIMIFTNGSIAYK
jgi:hypothetical protein